MSEQEMFTSPPELYTEEQLDRLENFITENYGDFPKVFRDNSPFGVKLDIAVIPPNTDNHFLTLVTMGFGAYRMNTPSELADKKLERAELVFCLPPNWKFDEKIPEQMWPVELLNRLAHLPIRNKTWLGWGHSVDYNKPFADDTELSAVLLLGTAFGDKASVCPLENGDEINFYQVIPLYDIEMRYKIEKCTDALLDRFGSELDPVLDLERRAVVTEDDFGLIDRVEDHSRKITEKQLDTYELNAANHIAAFVRWCIEHEMINEEFTDFFADELANIAKGKLDIRKFVMNYLGGEFTKEILTDEGQAFTDYYYDFYADEDSPCFPEDVDRMALDFFGEEKYHSEEFQNEAYLFVPYGEEYYVRLTKYINANYRKFSGLA